jgi:hypothetical protein
MADVGNSEKHVFPTGWPLECPPKDALCAEGTVYRIAKTNPLDPSDFLSVREEGKPFPPERECEAAGLSLFRKHEDAVHYRRKFPYLGDRIAQGVLAKDHGKLKPTPRGRNSHVTWWPYEGIERSKLFALVEEKLCGP